MKTSRRERLRDTVRWGSLVLASLACALASAAQPPQRTLYMDPSAPVEQRVEDLLARMTLEEKVAQITAIWSHKSELLERCRSIRSGETTSPLSRLASASSHGRMI